MKRENDCHANLFLSGIYFLMHKGKIVYVGESDCIIRRIGEHKSKGSKVFDNFKFISRKTFFWLDSKYHRLYAEHKCQRKFEPKYNKESFEYRNLWQGYNINIDAKESILERCIAVQEYWCFGVKALAEERGISYEDAEPIFWKREEELEEKNEEWEKSAQPVIPKLPKIVKDNYGGFKFIHKPATKKELGYP